MEQVDILNSEDYYTIGNPSLNVRIKSLSIDSFVVLGLMSLAAFSLISLNIQSQYLRVGIIILVLLYEPILVSVNQTIGQKVMGIQVRRLDPFVQSGNLVKLNIIQSIKRYVIKVILGAISLFTIRSNKYGQGIHDMISDSVITFK